MIKEPKMADYVIYKFNYLESKSSVEKRRRTEEYLDFVRRLIDAFAPETYAAITGNYTFWSRKNSGIDDVDSWAYKGNLTDTREIGLDMLHEFCGVIHNRQDSMFLYVPLSNPEILDRFDNNIPSFVTTVKRQPFPLYVKYNLKNYVK